MAKIQSTIALIAFMVIWAILPSGALARNAHQDHQGACARSTKSIKKGVSDLRYNGVLGKFAKSVGIHGFDGSLTKQMNDQLVIGKIAKAVNTENTGCNGEGGTFGAGTRHLYKGELVALKAPAKYGKKVCKHPNRKCKAIRVVVHTVFPVSCWNKNHKKRIVVWIWVRKPRHHKPHKKHKQPSKPAPVAPVPPPVCSGDTTNQNVGTAAQGGNCSVNTNITVCSPVNSPGSVVCSIESPPPPPTPESHAPQISCVFQPHIYVGENEKIWCEASDPDGDTLSVNVVGDSHVTVSGQIPVEERWDASPCPNGVSCYRATLWGKSPGMGLIVATVTANGESAQAEGVIEVLADEF